MATKAHAFFCFEVLAASFHDQEHANLQTIIEFYEQSQETEEQVAGDNEEEGVPAGQPQLPSIARLQATNPSSMSSTPSSVSVNSSTSQLTSSTPTSDIVSLYPVRLSVTESYPLFVTWNTLSRSGHKSLRGCIGTFEGLPLERGLAQYSLTSAFEDTRFSPIPATLLPSLSCSLTLLADFEECSEPMDWSLGTHGIRISFTHRYRRHGATYLPDVAVEQGWTKEETLESLMRKAGWEASGRRLLRNNTNPWEEVKDFRVVRYTGLKASASYSEWQGWRQTTKLAKAAESHVSP